jgi:hypothetical protein
MNQLKSTIHPSDDLQIENLDFIQSIFSNLPHDVYPVVCSKPGDPNSGGWNALPAKNEVVCHLSLHHNNYLNCASFKVDQNGSFRAIKENVHAVHCILVDDIGSKVELEKFSNFQFSSLIETSPNNYQGLIFLEEPVIEVIAAQFVKGLGMANLSDKGASGAVRWLRLPLGINGKVKYLNSSNQPFQCKLVQWRPSVRYTISELNERFDIEQKTTSKVFYMTPTLEKLPGVNPVYKRKPEEHPVVTALKVNSLYKKQLKHGVHDIICFRVYEHTDELPDGSAYFEPSEEFPNGGFRCHHSHGGELHLAQLLEYLGINDIDASGKSVIRLIPGETHSIIDAASEELAKVGKYYQVAGGFIGSIEADIFNHTYSIVLTTESELNVSLSKNVIWTKLDGRSKKYVKCDLDSRHIRMLKELKPDKLPVLVGIAYQPYFRESDKRLVVEPGYDAISKLYGMFPVPSDIIPENLNRETALADLEELKALIGEFHFATESDMSATISAIFTATVRPTLPLAPGFHVSAPVKGSGKSFLCDLIGIFATPGVVAKVSFPSNEAEATKVILGLLMKKEAVINFDDMSFDWKPYGSIKRIFTAETITDRQLGGNKMVTVNTQVLILSSGNNVDVKEDLQRRIITIRLDPQCEIPAMLSYKGCPLEEVKRNREHFIFLVLRIIAAYIAAGSPKGEVKNIASYGGAWADYCRHPLIWLGLPDPAEILFKQLENDSDSDALAGLMYEWWRIFGDGQVSVRELIKCAGNDYFGDLYEAILGLPVCYNGIINPHKFGQLLKKNEHRIIHGHKFESIKGPSRLEWRIVYVSGEPLRKMSEDLIEVYMK